MQNDAYVPAGWMFFLSLKFHKIQETTQIGLRGDCSAEFGRDVLGE